MTSKMLINLQHKPNDHPWHDASLEKNSFRRSSGPDDYSGSVHSLERGDCGYVFGVAVKDQFQER